MKNEKPYVQVRVYTETHKKLRIMAAKRGVSIVEMLRLILEGKQ